MRSSAQSGRVDSRMHVRDIRTDRNVNGHGNSQLVGLDQHAGLRKFGREDAAGEILAGSFAVADANAMSQPRDLIDTSARFLSHSELAFAKRGIDVFGGIPHHGNFEIVDERGPIHGDTRDESFAHQINEQWSESNFNYVATKSPKNGLFLVARFLR